MFNDLDYKGIEFPVSRKDFDKIEKKNNICIIVFCYDNNLLYPVNISDEKSKNCMNLLFNNRWQKVTLCLYKRLYQMCNKKKCKNKKHFGKYWLQCFSNKRVLVEHKEICLKINGKQTANLRSGSIKLKNHFKQLAVPFNIYTDFESVLKGVRDSDRGRVRSDNASYIEKCQDYIPCSFAHLNAPFH